MKLLKYLLAFIVIAVLVFFGRGLLTSEVAYQNEITIDAPVTETWAVMGDEATMPDWIPGYLRMEHISGTPNTVGAVSDVYVDNDGQEMVMRETITVLEPNQKMGMQFTMDFMTMDYLIELEEQDGKSHLTTYTTTKGEGIFAKSILAWMSGGMEEQEDQNLENLKGVVERNN